MTRKSIFKIGKLRDLTIQKIIDLRKTEDLIQCYYLYTSVNYTDDILKELKIVGGWVIEKPGSDKELLKLFKEKYFRKKNRVAGAGVLKTAYRGPSKAYLAEKNRGH
jgi:hypothetical protein